MADVLTDGMTKVAFVPTITDTSAPTEDEIDAGEDLETYITADGLGLEHGGDEVDTTSLASTFGATLPGRATVSGELVLKDQGHAAVPWTTFAAKPEGYLVVRRDVDSTTAWAENDVVDVYTVQGGLRRSQAPAANEVSKFAVTLFHAAAPVFGATVAAGA